MQQPYVEWPLYFRKPHVRRRGARGTMREIFRRELKDLKVVVIGIARDLVGVTHDATRALAEGDLELAEAVIAGDDAIDAACLGVEEHALEIIATQFPVARDLRLLHSLAHISMHMERM